MAPTTYYNARDHGFDSKPAFATSIGKMITQVTGQIQRLWERRNMHLRVGELSSQGGGGGGGAKKSLRGWERRWHWKRVFKLPHLLVVVWVIALFWGERWVFRRAVEECSWEGWEDWPEDATPHHLIFIADPQLIDPKSYPGRPKPLEALTILLTDTYMKRAYISLQKLLHPDTLFFLGDLFDGGREWKTAHGNSADPAWANGQRPSGEQALLKTWGKRYGEDFWLWEYERFGRIFYKYWNLMGDKAGPWQRNRRVISSLPGNHDLGFGAKIKIPIRNRFEVYFGEGNRVDVIGNHTFVSVDSVSLSAGGDADHDTKDITGPVEEFLEKVQSKKRIAVARELSLLAGKELAIQYEHGAKELEGYDFKNLPTLDPGPEAGVEFPTILLTHVPLFRDPGTPCGPQRERHPPATPPKGQTEPIFPDHGNAISVSKGYQYQNVLSENDSIKLIEKIGNVQSVFSGDDHDYCEIVHPPKHNNAREITVKSTSFAMGVRKPGFLLVSMWNPVDTQGKTLLGPRNHGKSLTSPAGHGAKPIPPQSTQTHLCLLPDELGILINYAVLIAVTIIILLIRAILVPVLKLRPYSLPSAPSSPHQPDSFSLLPTTKQDLSQNFDASPNPTHSSTSSTSNPQNAHNLNLASRSSAARTRSVSPANNNIGGKPGQGYGLPSTQVRFATPPLINGAGYYGPPQSQNYASNGRTYSPPHDESYEYKDKEIPSNPGFGFGFFGGNGNGKRRLPSAYDSGKGRKEDSMPTTAVGVVLREVWWSVWRVTWVVVCIWIWLIWFG